MAENRRYITSDELKTHNKPGDLWISIQGKIYDVSDWIKTHPGGDLPLRNLAGEDATDAFVAYHPKQAWSHLERFSTGLHLQDYAVSEMSKDYRRLVYDFTKRGHFDTNGGGAGNLGFVDRNEKGRTTKKRKRESCCEKIMNWVELI